MKCVSDYFLSYLIDSPGNMQCSAFLQSWLFVSTVAAGDCFSEMTVISPGESQAE